MENANSWLERLAAGDVAAAEQLWTHFFGRLHAYADARLRSLPHHVGEPDDVALSVFKSICRMIEKQTIPSVRDPEHLWPLLAVIAARKVARLVRRARPNQLGQQIRESDIGSLGVEPEEVSMLNQVIDREPSPELIVELRDLWAELLKRLSAADRFDPKYRDIADLWLEGRTVPEIADLTGVPQRTVARKLAMIRRLLQELAGEIPTNS